MLNWDVLLSKIYARLWRLSLFIYLFLFLFFIFICFFLISIFYWRVVDTQYYISFSCTTQWFNIYIHDNSRYQLSPYQVVTIFWLYFLCYTLHAGYLFILQLEVCTFLFLWVHLSYLLIKWLLTIKFCIGGVNAQCTIINPSQA